MLVDCTLVASILGLAGTFLPVLSLLSPFKIVNGILDFVRDFFFKYIYFGFGFGFG